MIPMIEKEIVEKRRWLEEDEVADVFAAAQSIPGAVAVNAAAFIGHRLAGVPGAITALIGVVLPTFLIVLALSALFLQVNVHPKIEAAMQGVRAAVVALVCFAGYKVAKSAILDFTTLFLAIAACLLLLFTPIHPVIILLSGFALGMLFVMLRTKLGWKTKLEYEKEEKEQGFIGDEA